jgi:RNA methyltransferase, TrmH family
MVSKGVFKFVKSLQVKKNRQKDKLFLVEGAKNVLELLASNFTIHSLFVSTAFQDQYGTQISKKETQLSVCSAKDLQGMGTLVHNEEALAVVHMPVYPPLTSLPNWVLILDGIRDPGNLGTIIRIADWYGIKHMLVSEDTVDLFNPKVVNSTKGSMFRVQVHYRCLSEFLEAHPLPVVGATLEGTSLHDFKFPDRGAICIGNESLGISEGILEKTNYKVTIPRFGEAESLNAGVAVALFLDALRRQKG